jgi:hypothetical protein
MRRNPAASEAKDMPRYLAAFGALGLLVLMLAIALTGLFGPQEPRPLLNANTGEPITLEAVMRDLDWHRETAEKLRRLD